MVNFGGQVAIMTVVIIAIFYQFFGKELYFDVLGHGRKVKSIKDFPNFNCEKIDVPGLEACEDMWLHEETGFLYMACSTMESRLNWVPSTELLDASKAGKKDRIAMLDTRGTGPAASRLTWLSLENFPGNNGDGALNVHGISFLANNKSNMLRILLINHRPPFDPVTGEALDASVVGANSTVEHFLTQVGSPTVRYVRTHAHELIQTPNSVQWVSDHSFVLTNDNSVKVGLRRKLDPVLGGGSAIYCDRNRCQTVISDIKLPNGITRSRDGLIYIASLVPGEINVYSLTSERELKLEDTIEIGFPIDNLSIDSDGDIFVATFPRLYEMIEAFKDHSLTASTSIFKVSRDDQKVKGEPKRQTIDAFGGDYIVEKILEDDGSLLSGTTTAVHDPKTGRIFLSGVIQPNVVVCQPRA